MKSEVYQELIRRAAHNVDLASYVLLLEACKKTLEEAPVTLAQLDAFDSKDMLSAVLARLGETITRIVPYDEFYFYTPASSPQRRLLANAGHECEHDHG